jgi:hypothetical protein
LWFRRKPAMQMPRVVAPLSDISYTVDPEGRR